MYAWTPYAWTPYADDGSLAVEPEADALSDSAVAADHLVTRVTQRSTLESTAHASDILAAQASARTAVASSAEAQDALSAAQHATTELLDAIEATDLVTDGEAFDLHADAAVADDATEDRADTGAGVTDTAEASDALAARQDGTASLADEATAGDALTDQVTHGDTLSDEALVADALADEVRRIALLIGGTEVPVRVRGHDLEHRALEGVEVRRTYGGTAAGSASPTRGTARVYQIETVEMGRSEALALEADLRSPGRQTVSGWAVAGGQYHVRDLERREAPGGMAHAALAFELHESDP